MRQLYGYTNAAAFNVRPEGDDHWFLTRATRDAALGAKQLASIRRGLSKSAATSGIYPVRCLTTDATLIQSAHDNELSATADQEYARG